MFPIRQAGCLASCRDPFSPRLPKLSGFRLSPLHHNGLPVRFSSSSSGPFQPLRGPPSPSSLGAPRPARTYTRLRRRARRLALLLALAAAVYLADSQFCASGLARSLRTFGTGLLVALDYKINFRPEPLPLIGQPGGIPALHRRSAERLSDLLRHNGGLYLKIGQAVAMQSALLPPEFQRMFARMFDDAPSVPWAEVERVIRQDFGGRSPEEVFGVRFTLPPPRVREGVKGGERGGDDGDSGKGLMERTARASASVAQVHWARLADGREVAVKIQKPAIKKQISWDLWAFKVVTWVYSRWFDLPLYSLVPFITERLELETDFLNEAQNSETMRQLVASEPALRGRVYVPPVYPELSSARVLTTEWIEGVRLWDRDAITAPLARPPQRWLPRGRRRHHPPRGTGPAGRVLSGRGPQGEAAVYAGREDRRGRRRRRR
ncbi:hypothetical protein OPQ81_000007 [Rhizoctonia solani]|nr:hypothetical protein OPQ81_000007 [Rhizoctonia solani]